MTLATVVSDTGPFISLEKLSMGSRWIQQLYGQILIPSTVALELYQGMFSSWDSYRNYYDLQSFIVIVEITDATTFLGYERLDIGDRQAIQLAWQRGLPLLIEEEQGRQVAQALGLELSGMAGQIVKAYRSQILSLTTAQTSLAELLKAGRIGKRLYAGLLEALQLYKAI